MIQVLNQNWLVYFMYDALACGRRFRISNIVNNFNGEALAIEIDLNIPAQRVILVLVRIVATHGYPVKMQMNNSPNFILQALTD